MPLPHDLDLDVHVDPRPDRRQASRTERTLPREWNDWFTRTAMPALRVPDFNMSSVSPAS